MDQLIPHRMTVLPPVNKELGSDVLLLCCWLGTTDRAEGQDGAPEAQRGRTILTSARVVEVVSVSVEVEVAVPA